MISHTVVSFTLALSVVRTSAQAPLSIYTDLLVNGFQDWSWATRDLESTAPIHDGTHAIQVDANAWEALSFRHAEFNATLYSDLVFWAHGGGGGGQQLQVTAEFGSTSGPSVAIPALTANTWQEVVVPLSALGVAGATDLHRFTIQLTAGGNAGTFHVDDIGLTAHPAPAVVHLIVDTTQEVRSADARWFGVNTAIWDSNFEDPQTVSLLNEMGASTLRFPGGSLSDEYHWATGTTLDNTWQWVTSFADFAHAATNIGARVFITVNYGTGTPEEAAGWVSHANITNGYGFQYWEIGNENYGTWETDTNNLPHHAYTYATRAAAYYSQMKAVDPTIKVGMVVVPGEGSFDNGYTDHPAVNPRTGETNYGWTPVLLSTLDGLGVAPDFLVHHHYPQWTDPNQPSASTSDALVLQSTGNWALDAADLRQQIDDYMGPAGANIELVVTENNSDAGAQGRQSTSLVSGLYYADSMGQLMKTEFNAFLWWDLRNGTDTNGSMDATLYGWRTYGDLGMINGLATRHPSFYAAKLMQDFVRAGDRVLDAESDYLLLSCYAVRRANGAITLLVLNKDTVATLHAEIEINGFVPSASAAVRSYGIPQDEAARTNGTLQAQDIAAGSFGGAGGAFGYDFPPLSMTLFTLAPSSPTLIPWPVASQPDDAFVFDLQGQPNVPYVVLDTEDLVSWNVVATNTMPEATRSITNAVAPGIYERYWQAVWQP